MSDISKGKHSQLWQLIGSIPAGSWVLVHLWLHSLCLPQKKKKTQKAKNKIAKGNRFFKNYKLYSNYFAKSIWAYRSPEQSLLQMHPRHVCRDMALAHPRRLQMLELDDPVRNLACHKPGVVACAKLICSLHSCEKYMEIRSSEGPHIHS